MKLFMSILVISVVIGWLAMFVFFLFIKKINSRKPIEKNDLGELIKNINETIF